MTAICMGRAGLSWAAGCALLLLLGCHREAPHSHDHEDEEVMAQMTIWTDRYEAFIEHAALIAGEPALFLTHLTDLKTLQPLRLEFVTFLLSLGEQAALEPVEGGLARPGIYEPILTFPQRGKWHIAIRIPSEEGDEMILLPPVTVFASKQEAARADVPEEPEGITFLKEQQWKIRAKTEPSARRELVESLLVPALVTARPGSLAQITPPMAGRLLPPPGGMVPMAGDRVEAGQTLALVQPVFSEMGARLIEAEGEVVRARLEVEQAELVLLRTRKLAEAKARSDRELQEAEFAWRMAQARHDASLALQASYRQATRNLTGQTDTQPAGDREGNSFSPPGMELNSPISGVIVSQLGAAVGEYITVERPVFSVLDARTVFIQAHVPEASLSRVSGTKGASLELPGERGRFIPITGDGRGRLVFVGLQVDLATRTVPLTYEAQNSDGRLRIGQSVNLHIETARVEESLAIPDSAIVEEAGQPIAFVQISGETFQKRELTLGMRDRNFVQVLSGIDEGERVVTQGAMAIRLASLSGAIPAHGHAH
jgi:membrane fusion protein, heavy metal efflux system